MDELSVCLSFPETLEDDLSEKLVGGGILQQKVLHSSSILCLIGDKKLESPPGCRHRNDGGQVFCILHKVAKAKKKNIVPGNFLPRDMNI